MTTALSDIWGKDPLWDKIACGMNRVCVEMDVDYMDRGTSGWSLGQDANNYLSFLQGPLNDALTQNGYTDAAAKLNEAIETLASYKGHSHTVMAPNADADHMKISLALSAVYKACPPLAERELTASEYCRTRHERGHQFPEMNYQFRAA